VSFLITSSLYAEQIGFWQVQKVKKNDTLNIREKANHLSKKISSIPYNAQCVINHGCGKDISFEAMTNMQEDEIKVFLSQAKEEWCYVEYNGKSGWSNKYYLKASKANCK
jgi:hypothetical protein